jgi:hypothetical protein
MDWVSKIQKIFVILGLRVTESRQWLSIELHRAAAIFDGDWTQLGLLAGHSNHARLLIWGR